MKRVALALVAAVAVSLDPDRRRQLPSSRQPPPHGSFSSSRPRSTTCRTRWRAASSPRSSWSRCTSRASTRTRMLINAFIYINPDALEEARALDRERRRKHGKPDSPLFGIPVLLKDNINTHDMPTTAGSVALEGSIPPDRCLHHEEAPARRRDRPRQGDADRVRQLHRDRHADRLQLARAASGSIRTTRAWIRGPVAPFNDGRPVLGTGGSSSGSGIGVAANLVTVAVGTETSGSILSPGTANSVVGIKPTLGLVSRRGILPITADQDTAGPLARTVDGCGDPPRRDRRVRHPRPRHLAVPDPGQLLQDYTRFLNRKRAARARASRCRANPYWASSHSTGADQVMLDAIEVLRRRARSSPIPYEIPNQADITNFGICTTQDPVPPAVPARSC